MVPISHLKYIKCVWNNAESLLLLALFIIIALHYIIRKQCNLSTCNRY